LLPSVTPPLISPYWQKRHGASRDEDHDKCVIFQVGRISRRPKPCGKARWRN
jgi:hypothetical protein